MGFLFVTWGQEMDAQLFQLDDMRAKQRIRTITEKISYAQMGWDGLALLRTTTLFWEQYATAMMSFHANLLSAAFSPSLKPPTISDKPRNWL